MSIIIHSVVFKLKHKRGSLEELHFLNAALRLSAIPEVRNLKSFRQTNKKNNFDYGLSMEFETAQAYENYNQHKDHKAFITNFWKDGVEDFLEIDYEPLS